MDILSTLNRAKSLLLQGQYEGAEHLIDAAITEIKKQQECDHQYHYFGDQKVRRCNNCLAIEDISTNPAASGRHETCSKNHLGVIFPK